MKRSIPTLCGCVWLAAAAAACGSEPPEYETVSALGEALFSDENMSMNRSQACATCHDPDHAFIDARVGDDGLIPAVSLGDDGVSTGDRNSPTAMYAAFVPVYHDGERRRFNKQGTHRHYEGPLGGMFWDGREPSLEGQAGGPPTNPVEMGMPDHAAVAERILENPDYIEAFEGLFEYDAFESTEATYAAFQSAVATYERTPEFSPFDSKYDRALRGEATLTFKELSGKSTFFSAFASCGICHQLHASGDPVKKFEETFSGYEYHNIGTPPRAGAPVDTGLEMNPHAAHPELRGRFKTPTLRNVAVTEPYMHNGVFRDLKTVVEFYDHFVNPEVRAINPETGAPWADPEVAENVSQDILEAAQPFTDYEVEALVCFLRTLTDARFEHLVQVKGIDCNE